MAPNFTSEYVSSVVSGLQQFFPGRTDIHALGKVEDPTKNKARYFKVEAPLTEELLRQHVLGQRLVGVYPIVDNKVKWFAVDIDAPAESEESFDAEEHGESWEPPTLFQRVWAEAQRQAFAFQNAGLEVYIERSRSGNGAHVWGFLSDWVPAATVRTAVKPLLLKSDMFDRMYPVQDSANAPGTKNPYGNLIALPFHGEGQPLGVSCFLDTVGRPIEASTFFALTITTNPVAVLELLAKRAPKERIVKHADGTTTKHIDVGVFEGRPSKPITGVLKLASPYGCDFMRTTYRERANAAVVKDPQWYAAIGQLTCFENGRDAAHVWSQGHPAYDPRDTDYKFEHALKSPPVGCAYIHENFPKLACVSCPMTAPYHRANRKLADIVATGEAELTKGGFGAYLPNIWKRDAREELAGIPFQLGALDRYTRFRKSELIVIGAQVSMGKTTSMIQLAANIVRQGYGAKFFSGEMGQDGMFERVLAHFANVDSRALMGEREGRLSREERAAVEREAAHLDALPLEFDFTATTPEGMYRAIERSVLRGRQALEDPYVVFFDYLQFAARQAGDDDVRGKTSRTVKELKLMAKLLEQNVTTSSQISRGAEGEDEPKVTWFKESGDIEAEMDVGIVWTGPRLEGRTVPRVATIVKQRRGTANVRAEYLLDQATARYEPVGLTPSTDRPPLFQPGELGFGETLSTLDVSE